MDTVKLREIRNSLDLYIGASDNWADSYFVHDAEFKTLLLERAKLKRMFERYFTAIAPKLIAKINWQKFNQVNADESEWVDSASFDDATSSAEADLMLTLATTLLTMIVAGMLSSRIDSPEGLTAKLVTMDKASLTDYIRASAEKNAGNLVTQIDKTTRDRINNAVVSAINEGGSSIAEVRNRLTDIINNPARAQLIAHTESVNSYATGRHDYATATGATTHSWETESGRPCPACEACQEDGEIPIEQIFSGGYLTPADAHPDCYCIESTQWVVTDATTGDVTDTIDLGSVDS